MFIIMIFYNNIDTQVRSLTSLRMNPDCYGPMLIPAVMSKSLGY